jgi:hypothetical protein
VEVELLAVVTAEAGAGASKAVAATASDVWARVTAVVSATPTAAMTVAEVTALDARATVKAVKWAAGMAAVGTLQQ